MEMELETVDEKYNQECNDNLNANTEIINDNPFKNFEEYEFYKLPCVFSFLNKNNKNINRDDNRVNAEKFEANKINSNSELKRFLGAVRTGSALTSIITRNKLPDGSYTPVFNKDKISKILYEKIYDNQSIYDFYMNYASNKRGMPNYNMTLFRFMNLDTELYINDVYTLPLPCSFTSDPEFLKSFVGSGIDHYECLPEIPTKNIEQKVCRIKSIFILDINNETPHIFNSFIKADEMYLSNDEKNVFENNDQREIVIPGCKLIITGKKHFKYNNFDTNQWKEYKNGDIAYDHFIYKCNIVKIIDSKELFESIRNNHFKVKDLYEKHQLPSQTIMRRDRTNYRDAPYMSKSERYQYGGGYYQKYLKYKAKYMALKN